MALKVRAPALLIPDYSLSSQLHGLPNRPSTLIPSPSLKAKANWWNLPVSEIILTGTVTNNTLLGVFHFRLSLVSPSALGLNTQSIWLDMNPSYTDMSNPLRGLLIVEHKKYASSHTPGTTPFSIRVRAGVTSGDICYHLLSVHKMDQYMCVSVNATTDYAY